MWGEAEQESQRRGRKKEGKKKQEGEDEGVGRHPPSFPCSSVSKESACSAGDPGSIPGLGRSPGEGNGNPLQYSCLENPMDREAWHAASHGVSKSQTWLRD